MKLNLLTNLISDFGLPVVVGAALVYVVLRGEIRFRYPSRHRRRN